MIDRHMIGDIGLAVLLALPTVALSRPQPPETEQALSARTSAMVEQAALADRTPTDRRSSLQG